MKKLRTAEFNEALNMVARSINRELLKAYTKCPRPENLPYNPEAQLEYRKRIMKHGGVFALVERTRRINRNPGHPVLTTR